LQSKLVWLEQETMLEDPSISAGRRAGAYWNIDGLAELYIGLIWVFVAFSLYATAHLDKSSPWFKPLLLGGTLTWMAAIFGGQRIVAAVKTRVTYPRTGYVAAAKPRARVWWLPVVILALAATLPFGPQQLVLPITGLIGAAIAGAVAVTTGVRRLYALGGLFLVLGLALGAANVELNRAFSLLFGVAGAANILSGGITLRQYLHHA
jgi:hypothetical protein